MRLAVLTLLPFFVSTVLAAEGDGTATVAKKPLVLTISAKGRIEPAGAETVRLKPYSYRGRFVVVEALEPGTAVKKGDVVLRFDPESLEQAVDDARFELGLAGEEHRIRMERLKIGAAESQKELERRERDVMLSERQLEDWRTYEKPRADAYAELDRKQQDFGVENAKEELRQLEEMYGEDELVDETEKIVLERSRFNLRRRIALRDLWLEGRRRTVEVSQKRKEEELLRDLDRKRFALQKARQEADHGEKSRRMSEMRAVRALEKKRRDTERLEALLEGMVVRAPADGILLHGPLAGGLDRRFAPGSSVNVAEGVISVASPNALVATLRVSAEEALRLAPGASVEIAPGVKGAGTLRTTVESISALPRGGTFEVRCPLPEATDPRLLGASTKAKIFLEKTAEVLVVPSEYILEAGGKHFCLKKGEAGLTPVEIGRSDGRLTEVTRGLAEGDEILAPAGETAK